MIGLEEVCPRCNSTEFREIDCGPDTYEDDIAYTSYQCTNCGLWYDGWVKKWFIDIKSWRDVEDGEEFKK